MSGKHGSVLCQLQQLCSPLQTSMLGRELILLTACSSAPSEEEQKSWQLAVAEAIELLLLNTSSAASLEKTAGNSSWFSLPKPEKRRTSVPTEPYEKIQPRGTVLSESLRNTDLQENKCTKDIINTENMQVLTKRCGVTCQVE